ncbi:PASTA domain-containing protein [Conexibacter sp. CPCC 206217]|uniref:PASTA domain-containing protein n=1 Tax=Conexibacter sp. CPCC 206217 TaxID=3064574 RepID=UPI002722784D|nr:PASTA domain-containing protein [Conexibacter sp. CPCC 206217]MDO8210717.1 PASTA domain-containing protein [Conexibacter sp. CPCC 206217]
MSQLPRTPSWTTVALGCAAGFLVGVLLVVALGIGQAQEPPARTITVVSRAPALSGDETVITKTAVPDVVGERLDVAHDRLKRAGFMVKEEDNGLFGTVIDSNWEVKEQDPAAGTALERGSTVHIKLDRR